MASIDVEAGDEFRLRSHVYQIRGLRYREIWPDGNVGPWLDHQRWHSKVVPHSRAIAILRAYGLEVQEPTLAARVTHAESEMTKRLLTRHPDARDEYWDLLIGVSRRLDAQEPRT